MNNKKLITILKKFQKNEITEHHIYRKLAGFVRHEKNKDVLLKISNDEKKHYEILKKYSNTPVKPSLLKVYFYYWIARLLGLTFGIKLMEKGEAKAQLHYEQILDHIDEVRGIIIDEDDHENALIALIEEERLDYIGSIVLGLNDALVELTGTLAGLSFALQKNRLIAFVGLITGIAASFSMAASEYLSKKSDNEDHPLKSAAYTGIAYIFTVIFLVLPFFLMAHYITALIISLGVAIFIIFIFNYYISVAKDLNFQKRFFEMAAISLSVAAFSFGVGFFIRSYFDIDV